MVAGRIAIQDLIQIHAKPTTDRGATGLVRSPFNRLDHSVRASPCNRISIELLLFPLPIGGPYLQEIVFKMRVVPKFARCLRG